MLHETWRPVTRGFSQIWLLRQLKKIENLGRLSCVGESLQPIS
jgi:hypothetical protein